jgi:hypothetical protein
MEGNLVTSSIIFSIILCVRRNVFYLGLCSTKYISQNSLPAFPPFLIIMLSMIRVITHYCFVSRHLVDYAGIVCDSYCLTPISLLVQYGLDTSEFSYNPSESQRFQQANSQPTEEKSRCTIM